MTKAIKHKHLIAGDHGYLPIYFEDSCLETSDECYESIKNYVETVIETSFDVNEYVNTGEIKVFDSPAEALTDMDKWTLSNAVDSVQTDTKSGVVEVEKVIFNRSIASIDYVELISGDDKHCKEMD